MTPTELKLRNTPPEIVIGPPSPMLTKASKACRPPCTCTPPPMNRMALGTASDLNWGLAIRVVAVELDMSPDTSGRSAEQPHSRTEIVVDANHRIPGFGGSRKRSASDLEPALPVSRDIDRRVHESAIHVDLVREDDRSATDADSAAVVLAALPRAVVTDRDVRDVQSRSHADADSDARIVRNQARGAGETQAAVSQADGEVGLAPPNPGVLHGDAVEGHVGVLYVHNSRTGR